MRARRLVLDRSFKRVGDVIVAGSPLRLLRLSAAGRLAADRVEHAGRTGEGLTDPAALALAERLVDIGAIHPLTAPSDPPPRYGRDDVTVVTPIHRRGPGHAPVNRAGPGVVVVDDGSDPPIVGAALRLPTNRGPAAARNAAIATVTTDLVAFVDDDVDTGEGDEWVVSLLGHFDDARVGLVAPRVKSQPGPSVLARAEMRFSPLDLGAEPARISAGTRVGYVPAAALICRRAALEQIEGFCEELRFGEDVDLVWRLDAAGWRCRYDPSVVVHHQPRPTWVARARQRIDYAGSAGPLARRHGDALAPVRLSGWSLATWALIIAGSRAGGIVLGVASAAALAARLPMLPARTALGIAATGHLYAGRQLTAAVRRAWWPVVVVLAALGSATARRILVVSAIAAGHPLILIDDLCSSVGLWRGARRAATVAPLLPRIGSWPARSTV
jgi:mycofactocin system glycosyltransferase